MYNVDVEIELYNDMKVISKLVKPLFFFGVKDLF